jgi:hypothetical protein
MMLKIVVAENGTVMIRETIDGQYHRRTILPGDDYSGEQGAVFAACEKAHRPEVIAAFLDSRMVRQPSPEEQLAAWRAGAKCSRLQGRLTLGAEVCAALDAMAADPATPWAMRETITGAIEWRRSSQTIDELGYLLGYDAPRMDALFEAAMQVAV